MATRSNTLPNQLGGRYTLIELLGKGGMGVVYRALDRLTGQPVALKRVLADTTELVFNTRSTQTDAAVALAQEFRALASLRHPHIISVLDYGFDAKRQAYFTMELLEDGQDFLSAVRPETANLWLIQLLQALVYLHRRGIIHRDLKPGNVLVTHGTLKVLDFGLSLRREQISHSESSISGTLAYIAPELFTGSPASVASDLYAVGVMVYQVFTGKHPFQSENSPALLKNILYSQPDLSMFEPGLAELVARLLAKNPADRYPDAAAVLGAIQDFSEQPQSESPATRESFLQAAQLVGRDAELDQLSTAVAQASQSRGSAWLVGGESGVGKSRLLDEIRILALVEGAIVLRGQAISEGGGPFQLWLDVLRLISVTTGLSDDEASVLLDIVPDLAALLARPVSAAPSIDPDATQERLLATIEAVFTRQSQPILIILEDLHWANESLDLLRRLCRLSLSQNLLIIGSYRDDEWHELPALVPEMQLLPLKRFSSSSVEALIESVLGAPSDASGHSGLAQWLQRETEGNAFFLVETLRALAEETGQLAKIGSMTLPENVMTGGVRRVVQRRIDRVPAADRELLDLAALAGRRLKLDVLARLLAASNVTDWLYRCANVGVLDFQAGEWQFAHDKLREFVLTAIDASVRPSYHRRIADALESSLFALSTTHNPVGPSDAMVTEVAYHSFEAHDWVKAQSYATHAGERAQALHTPHLAVEHYSRAIDAANHLGLAHDLNTYRARGYGYDTLGQFELALADYTFVLQHARTAADRERELQALLDLGQLWAGRDYGQTGIHFREALNLARALGDPAKLGHSLNRLGNWYVNVEQAPQGLKFHQEAADLFAKIEDKAGLASTYDLLGMANYMGANLKQSKFYLEQAIALFREMDDKQSLASSLATYALRSGAAYQARTMEPTGDSLTESMQDVYESLAITREIGQRAGEVYALWQLGCCYGPLGEYGLALEFTQQAIALAEPIDHRQWLGAAYGVLGSLMMDLLDYDRAEAHYRKSLSFAIDSGSYFFIRLGSGYLANLYIEQGALAEAEVVLAASPEPDAPPWGAGQRAVWYARARLELVYGNTRAAQSRLDRLGQSSIMLECLRGEICLAEDHPHDALTAFKKAKAMVMDALAMAWRVDLDLCRTYRILGLQYEANSALNNARQVTKALAENMPDETSRAHFLAQFAQMADQVAGFGSGHPAR